MSEQDRLQELRDAIAWNQRQGIGHVVLKTELVEWVIAEVERLHSQVDSGFARNYGLNKGIENAVDAFVKAADERDKLKRELANAEHGADLIAEEREAYKSRVAMLEPQLSESQAKVARLRSMAPYVEDSGHYCLGMTKARSDAQHAIACQLATEQQLGEAQAEAVRLRDEIEQATMLLERTYTSWSHNRPYWCTKHDWSKTVEQVVGALRTALSNSTALAQADIGGAV